VALWERGVGKRSVPTTKIEKRETERGTERGTESMSRPWLVTPLTEATDFHDHVLITLYRPGQNISVVARKDAYFLEVQSQIAAQMGLKYRDIQLVLNEKTPLPLAKVSSLMGQLEEANYVIEMDE